MSLAAALEEWERHLADERAVSPHTRRAYLDDVGRFLAFLGRFTGSDASKIAPGDVAWKSDIEILNACVGQAKPQAPLRSVVAKYVLNDRIAE